MNKTFAIITPVLLEHQYINYYVDYHLNLGFDKIYIMIDNLDYEQQKYNIKNAESQKKIVFLYMKDYVTDYSSINFNIHKSSYIHKALQNMYSIITEDYTILLGVDSFLFLDNMTIQQFFNKYEITDDISQIMFKWIIAKNIKYKSEYNLLHNINNYNHSYGFHYFTLGNRKKVTIPSVDSHHYDIKNNNEKIWYNNKIYEINKNDNFWSILNIIGKDNNAYNGSIIHFLIRSISDAIIKTYYFWNEKSDSRIENIKNFINNLTTTCRLKYINITNNNINIENITLNIENDNNKDDEDDYNDKLINTILTDCDITKMQLFECMDKLGIKI